MKSTSGSKNVTGRVTHRLYFNNYEDTADYYYNDINVEVDYKHHINLCGPNIKKCSQVF